MNTSNYLDIFLHKICGSGLSFWLQNFGCRNGLKFAIIESLGTWAFLTSLNSMQVRHFA